MMRPENKLFRRNTMYSSSETSINYKAILEAALSDYKKKTGTELLDNPLATEAQRCDTVDGALTILQDQAKAFPQSKDGDQRLMEQISPLAKVLFSFSETLAFGNVGLVHQVLIRGDSRRILTSLHRRSTRKRNHCWHICPSCCPFPRFGSIFH
ncbi:hypothetical protein EI94DRAFT_1269940 [Lactarius quietus]|nr:hypothetical protein EI94DRAFT_1269940 [Lactarius quietus]